MHASVGGRATAWRALSRRDNAPKSRNVTVRTVCAAAEAVRRSGIIGIPDEARVGATIHIKCRACGNRLQIEPEDAATLACPGCGHPAGLRLTPMVAHGDMVDVCAACGHDDLYVQKDFNRALGLAIVVAGVVVSVVFFALDRPLAALGALAGMAAVDALVYASVGRVTVCYACHAIYRGFPPNPRHHGFDLELLERHGGKDPRH